MILYNQIEIARPSELFDQYNITRADRQFYNSLLNVGKEQEAIDAFVEKYMSDPIELYNAVMQRYLFYAQQGEITGTNRNRLETSVAILTFALSTLIIDNFTDFTDRVYAPAVFEATQISKMKVQRMILDETLEQFNTLTANSLTRIQSDVLQGIRTMQMEMITLNQTISSRKFVGAELDRYVNQFREQLRQKYPQYYKMMEDGKFFRYNDGKMYNLTTYNDMATRTTLLNVDRTSVEVQSRVRGEKVVEYYLRDNRPLKTGIHRQICKSILSKKIMGKSLLALDDDTAVKLGIMTVASAKGTSDYAMGPNCRHSIKRVSRRFRTRIDAILRQSEEQSA